MTASRQRPSPAFGLRFLAFGLAVVLGAGALSARLFAHPGRRHDGQYTALAATNRTVLEAIAVDARARSSTAPARRSSPTSPRTASRSARSDLPESAAPRWSRRSAALIGMDPTDINVAIDSNPGSRYDIVRVAQDVDPTSPASSPRPGTSCPGVQVVVETQRNYDNGPLFSHILGYTGPISGERARRPAARRATCPTTCIGRAGIESTYEDALRGDYGLQTRRARRRRPRIQVLRTDQPAGRRKLAAPDDRHAASRSSPRRRSSGA